MEFDLIVTEPFAGYAVGTRITDDSEIEKILAGHNRPSVIRVAAEPDRKRKAKQPD